MMSRSGMWRIPAGFYALKNGYPFTDTRWGMFKCADFASMMQFNPSWEPAVRKEIEACTGTFVDVGANIGFYTVIAAKNGCQVFAFEPNLKAFDCLVANVAANQVKERVSAFRGAAWSKDGQIALSLGRHTDVSKVGTSGIPIPAYALDSVLEFAKPALIKIDAEDSEEHVLEGAKKTLLKYPKVIFEAWDRRRAGARMKMFPDGYTFKRLDRTNYLAW